jgi:N utilization substance protein B
MSSSRHKDRKLVLELLYENDVTHKSLKEILDTKRALNINIFLSEFAIRLLNGVIRNRELLDEILERYSECWKVPRMPVVDRNILRMGLYEILFEDDIPPAVTINECVELAKVYSTDEARRFINGVLGRIVRDLNQLKEEVKAF